MIIMIKMIFRSFELKHRNTDITKSLPTLYRRRLQSSSFTQEDFEDLRVAAAVGVGRVRPAAPADSVTSFHAGGRFETVVADTHWGAGTRRQQQRQQRRRLSTSSLTSAGGFGSRNQPRGLGRDSDGSLAAAAATAAAAHSLTDKNLAKLDEFGSGLQLAKDADRT